MRALALAGFALLVLVAATGSSRAEKRLALVVGNSAYQHLARLDNPVSDAQLIAKTLKSVGFELVGGKAQTDLDRTGFERAIREFGAGLERGGVGLFYYAGHGLQLQGANYLVPVGANPVSSADADFELVDANTVLRQMESAGSGLNIVILDACRNNPFGGRGLRDAGGGLATMRAPSGTVISYATQPGNVALDGTTGHSPYTAALAKMMEQPGLQVFEAFNQVAVTVDKTTGGKQQPWLSASPLEGTFYFLPPTPVAVRLPTPAPAPAPTTTVPSPFAPVDAELIFWETIAHSRNLADFEAYVKQYPEGKFVALAKNRIAELRTASTEPAPSPSARTPVAPAPAPAPEPVPIPPAPAPSAGPVPNTAPLLAPAPAPSAGPVPNTAPLPSLSEILGQRTAPPAPAPPASSPNTTKVIARAGEWQAFGGKTTTGRGVCGISSDQPGGRYFGVKFFAGDDTYTIQIGSHAWKIVNGNKYKVTMRLGNSSPWNAKATGMHFNDGDGGIEFSINGKEQDEFMREFRSGGSIEVRFTENNTVAWKGSLDGVNTVGESFVRCLRDMH